MLPRTLRSLQLQGLWHLFTPLRAGLCQYPRGPKARKGVEGTPSQLHVCLPQRSFWVSHPARRGQGRSDSGDRDLVQEKSLSGCKGSGVPMSLAGDSFGGSTHGWGGAYRETGT